MSRTGKMAWGAGVWPGQARVVEVARASGGERVPRPWFSAAAAATAQIRLLLEWPVGGAHSRLAPTAGSTPGRDMMEAALLRRGVSKLDARDGRPGWEG